MNFRRARPAIVVIGLAIGLSSCEVSIRPNIEVVGPAFSQASRLPVTVIFDSDQSTREIQSIEIDQSKCYVGDVKVTPTPIGENFELIVKQHLNAIFEKVVPHGTADANSTFEVRLEKPSYRMGCRLSPEQFVSLKGEARALDSSGREIWRSPAKERRSEINFMYGMRRHEDLSREIGREISRSMAAMASEWTSDLLRAPYFANQIAGLSTVAMPSASLQPAAQTVVNDLRPTALLDDKNRVALVIGNDAYSGLPKLNNATRDAIVMSQKLRELGFETMLRTNVGRVALGRSISEFGDKIKQPGTIALVFYAGHGIQAFERNWLVPIDAKLEADIDLETEAVDAQRILRAMDDAQNPLNILILDACRDNPLPRRSRSAERGLAVMSTTLRGSFIAYSASPNQKANDGAPGGHGIFTSELLKALDEPGLKIEDVFKRTNAGVQMATGGRQVPWFNASIQGDFYFRPANQQ